MKRVCSLPRIYSNLYETSWKLGNHHGYGYQCFIHCDDMDFTDCVINIRSWHCWTGQMSVQMSIKGRYFYMCYSHWCIVHWLVVLIDITLVKTVYSLGNYLFIIFFFRQRSLFWSSFRYVAVLLKKCTLYCTHFCFQIWYECCCKTQENLWTVYVSYL